MTLRSAWTREQLLVAFDLYCRLPFGRLHGRNPEIVEVANAIGRTPSALAMKLGNIASLDPAITSTGRRGLNKASSNDRAMWEEMQSDWERFAVECRAAVNALVDNGYGDAGRDEEDDEFPLGEDRLVRAKARVGQRFFRSAVLSAYNSRCCITGLSIPALLVASHIVPWKADVKNRANPRNGLLLSALHDKAFDAGLLTISNDMTVQVSGGVLHGADRYFSEAIGRFDGQRISLPEKFGPHPDFLEYHRAHIFRG